MADGTRAAQEAKRVDEALRLLKEGNERNAKEIGEIKNSLKELGDIKKMIVAMSMKYDQMASQLYGKTPQEGKVGPRLQQAEPSEHVQAGFHVLGEQFLSSSKLPKMSSLQDNAIAIANMNSRFQYPAEKMKKFPENQLQESFFLAYEANKEVDVAVHVDEDKSREEEEASESSFEEDKEDEKKEEEEECQKKTQTKNVKETTYEWELLKDVKAIWLRNQKEMTDQKYKKFYHSLANDFSDEKRHFTANDAVEFKAVKFVPPKAPHDLYESFLHQTIEGAFSLARSRETISLPSSYQVYGNDVPMIFDPGGVHQENLEKGVETTTEATRAAAEARLKSIRAAVQRAQAEAREFITGS